MEKSLQADAKTATSTLGSDEKFNHIQALAIFIPVYRDFCRLSLQALEMTCAAGNADNR